MSSHLDFASVPSGVAGIDPMHPCRSGARILDAEAGLVERRREKLAIVGYATSSRDLAPFCDESYEIMGLNQLYRFVPRADFWADLHVNWEEENVVGTDHRGWLRDCGIPVLLTATDPGLPTSVRFPIEEVIRDVGFDYFTSSVALLIGWAIHQGYREIGLWGIDLVVGTEYDVQKACVEFLLGVAHGRGVHVRLPAACALLRHSHRYGYFKEPDGGLLKLSELDGRRSALTKQRDQAVDQLKVLDGAIAEVAAYDRWRDDPDARLAALKRQRSEATVTAATFDGAVQETSFWHHVAEVRSRGVGVR